MPIGLRMFPSPRLFRSWGAGPALRWWTKSRCDFVCLRSRHFVAMPCPLACECFRPPPDLRLGCWASRKNTTIHRNWPKYHFFHFEISNLQSEILPQPQPKTTLPARVSGGGRSRAATSFACEAGTLWRCHPRAWSAVGALPSRKTPESTKTGRNNTFIILKYQICNLKSYPNPNQKPPCMREPPVVDEVALRLRLPAEQALCGDAMPIGLRIFPSPAWSAVGALPSRKTPESTKTGRNITFIILKYQI